MNEKSIAVVMGYKGTNSTGLVRSLGKGGFNVVFASSYSRIESKYVSDYLALPSDEHQKLEVLCQYLRKLPSKAALFTGDDLTGGFIENNHKELSQYCYCPYANGRLREISDKTVMAQIAKDAGLNVPEFAMFDLSDDAFPTIEFPVIIKPYAGYAGSKKDIQICRNNSELSDSLGYLKKNGYAKVMIQRLIEGSNLTDVCLMGFSLDDGTVRIPCVIRKIRSYPAKQGSLSYGHVENELLQSEIPILQEFVRKTGYVGIFDIDMLVSDGIPYFIEINYRNGQNGFVATAAGYNIPANWFKGMQGNPTEEQGLLSEVYYMDEHSDYKHVLEGAISFGTWIKDLRAASVYAMFCRGDQRPFWRQYIRIPEKWKRKLRSIVRNTP